MYVLCRHTSELFSLFWSVGMLSHKPTLQWTQRPCKRNIVKWVPRHVFCQAVSGAWLCCIFVVIYIYIWCKHSYPDMMRNITLSTDSLFLGIQTKWFVRWFVCSVSWRLSLLPLISQKMHFKLQSKQRLCFIQTRDRTNLIFILYWSQRGNHFSSWIWHIQQSGV